MRRILLIVTMVLALAAPAASVYATSGPTMVYSELYLKLIAAYPSGMVPDDCDAVLFVTGRNGICDHRLDPAYFYPDGTFRAAPWYEDASSPTGWSIAPDLVGQGMAQQPSGVAGRGRGGPRQHLVVQPGRAEAAPIAGARPALRERAAISGQSESPTTSVGAWHLGGWAIIAATEQYRGAYDATLATGSRDRVMPHDPYRAAYDHAPMTRRR